MSSIFWAENSLPLLSLPHGGPPDPPLHPPRTGNLRLWPHSVHILTYRTSRVTWKCHYRGPSGLCPGFHSLLSTPHHWVGQTIMQMTHNCFCLFYGLKPRCKHLCVWPTSLWEVNSPEAQSGLSCSSFQRRYVPCPILDLSINIHNSVVPATCMARNLGLTLDDLLSFAANSAVISHSCRLMGQGTRDQPPQPHGLRPPTDR